MTDDISRLAKALEGRYGIERELGAGGMATVYLARDIRHDRHVALKVLRPELAAVIGAARFLNEIKTTANLQHPHILALHDSGEVDGTVFYVMPYVDGESLRDRLNRERQLPIDEAIRIAIEVAGALAYAHQHKVIHRDIKPENILLQGGHAVVADFGIALAAARTDSGSRMTETGMSLGTPHYMSPEQAMGEREITAKTDIYALGCVLYEMLAGEPPFTGPTAQAIVGRVMTEEPRSLTTQRRTIPRHIDAAVHRALAKLPADRFASAAAFAEALTNPGAMPIADTTHSFATGSHSRRNITPLLIGGILAAAIGAFILGRSTAPEPPKRVIQFAIQPPDSVVSLSACCGIALALSPDGETVVFVGVGANRQMLYKRTIGRVGAEPISGTEGGAMPFFSPDGQWLGFFADGKLKKVPMSGGPPLPITNIENVREATWGEGDVIVFGTLVGTNGRPVLRKVSAAGGESQPLTATPDTSAAWFAPTLLPDGKWVLFTMRNGGIANSRIGAVEIATGKVDTLAAGTRAMYANGYLVYAAVDNTLLAQPFDPDSRRTTGPAVAILDRIALHGGTTHEFTVSATGALAYETSGSATAGEALRVIGDPTTNVIQIPGRGDIGLEDPALSPDGKRILFRITPPDASVSDLWMLNRQQNTLERFTVGGGGIPAWSRDGKRVAYSKLLDGLHVRNADGTGESQLLLRLGTANLAPGSWLADGKTVLFVATNRPETKTDIGIIALGDTAPRWLIVTEFNETQPQLSPDGRWIAYTSDRTGATEIYVQSFDGNGPRMQVSNEGGHSPRWSPDGRTLYYIDAGALHAAVRSPGAAFDIASRKRIAETPGFDNNTNNVNWDVFPDGKKFVYIDQGGGNGPGAGQHIVWIRDWPELVKAMATRK